MHKPGAMATKWGHHRSVDISCVRITQNPIAQGLVRRRQRLGLSCKPLKMLPFIEMSTEPRQPDCPFIHKDPFDRFIIATALTLGLLVITADRPD